MPTQHFAFLLIGVILAAALTVGLISAAGPGVMAAILPITLIASFALRYLRK